MLIIQCPWCGERDHTEFTYGGDARPVRPVLSAPDREWVDYVYLATTRAGRTRSTGITCRVAANGFAFGATP